MRIIAGSARGTKLETLPGENTRPTSERAKEAVFSMLQFELAGRRVLDLFAGSGQLALEALSRGASDAVLCDASAAAAAIVRKNIEKTHMADRCRLMQADYATCVRMLGGEQFDLIFLDPPYAQRLVCPALRTLLSAGAVADGALIVCESEEADIFETDPSLAAHFSVRKVAKYGAAHVTVLEYQAKNDGEERKV
jgi:16S rRNA (guanine(966)-N(2))-methyltransferase RsmD